MRKGLLLYLVAVIFLSSCAKSRMSDHPEWAKYYIENGINNGCIMLFDNNHESVHYYNKVGTTHRYLPASNFNIFNCLVALETNIAPDDQMIISWDSVVRKPEWNKDLNMRDAFTVHSVPFFQEMARRIGAANMQHYLDTVKYGNMKIGTKIDECWLNNSLQISADEEVGFLKRLYFHELPFSERAQRMVRSMMLQEDSTNYKLYYYTGTGDVTPDSTVRWIIGYAEKIEHIKEAKESQNPTNVRTYPYFFAQNFVLPKSDTTKDWNAVRLSILRKVLTDYGALPKGK